MSFKECVCDNLREDFKYTKRFLCQLLLIIVRVRIYFSSHCKVFVLRSICKFCIEIVYICFCRLLCNCEISRFATIGPGWGIFHPINILIGAATIGRNCTMGYEVAIGYASKKGVDGLPTLGNNVFIGAGAKLIGPIHIGDNVKIGANSVVFDDLPKNSKVYNVVKIIYGQEDISSTENK